MPSDESLKLVTQALNKALIDNGHPEQQLKPGTNILHDTPLDSMGLAVAVLNLEEVTGKDPFAEGFINFQTVGELAELYDK